MQKAPSCSASRGVVTRKGSHPSSSRLKTTPGLLRDRKEPTTSSWVCCSCPKIYEGLPRIALCSQGGLDRVDEIVGGNIGKVI
ncbi:hypothetical protein KQX54_021477 [Cotesia glomerata]|uniref:Uncharacterized protein n=1 Tax=Cotesia glomerata TaxID=32391 RepID=A0AAV7J8N5_COTGL|nr:hypothetical protein KQX54_021477 [Cotesia glomerata]